MMKTLRNLNTNYQNPDFIQVTHKDTVRHKYLIVLASVLIASAFFSFCLHFEFIKKMNYILKIPIFAVLGNYLIYI